MSNRSDDTLWPVFPPLADMLNRVRQRIADEQARNDRGICSIPDCDSPILGWCEECGRKLCRSHLADHFRYGADVTVPVQGWGTIQIRHTGAGTGTGTGEGA